MQNIYPTPAAAPSSGRARYFPDATDEEWNDWRWQYRNRVRDLESLGRLLGWTSSEIDGLSRLGVDLHIGVTPYYLSLIDAADPRDPIRRQAVPSLDEYTYHSVGLEDPLGENPHMPVDGIVHKYPDRVLFLATNMCPVYCRHCTRRREWQGGEAPRSRHQLEAMIAYIARTPSVRDVIISGGDPLSLPIATLEFCLSEIGKIEHVEIIRIHTRYPVVLPQRIDDDLASLLSRYAPIWMNTHFNHPREITREAAAACRRILRAGVPLNNQTVLMRGVNDDARTITALCHGLLKIGVRPYYLFHCDPVNGAEHLRTSVWKGVEIIEKMRGHTSGLAIPTYAVDTEGGGKVPINPDYILSATEDTLVLRNFEGVVFNYGNPRPAGERTDETFRTESPELRMFRAPSSGPCKGDAGG